MSAIHFVGGEKGGVGKSVMGRVLSQYFLDKNLPYVGLDADQSHATLSRYYQDFSRALNLDVFESTDSIMELAVEKDQQILIDLPAQSQRFLDHWLEENSVLEMCKEMNINLLYWYLVDDGQDCAQLLEKFLSNYASNLFCVVVKNQGRGSDFSDIDALIKAQTENTQLLSVSLPALHLDTMHKIDKLNFSFWAAQNIKQGTQHLSLMERQRTRVWMKKAYALVELVLSQQNNDV